MTFDASMCIDPVTNLIEIACLAGPKTAKNATALFKNHWLAQHPCPQQIVHDHSPEFHGHNFQFPLDCAGIKAVNVTPHAPTANAIIKAAHKVIGQMICALINVKAPENKASAKLLVNKALATAMHALRCNLVSSLGNFLSVALVFIIEHFSCC